MTAHILRRALLATALLVSVSAVPPAFAHDHGSGVAGGSPLAEHVRTANERFADVSVALSEGYAPIPCVSGIEGGAMGIHYVNGALIEDEVVEIGKPEAVMYEPGPDGKLTLVAV